MKKVLSFLTTVVLLISLSPQLWAYDGVITTSAGNIYYIFRSSTQDIGIVYPVSSPYIGFPDSYWEGFSKPTGDLVIPDSVNHNGTKYPVTMFYGNTFINCSGLTSVTIPSTIKIIGGDAFKGCTGIVTTNYTGTVAGWHSIDIVSKFANPTYYSQNLYLNNVPLTNLVFPDTITKINANFSYIYDIQSVTIPVSVTTIVAGAFDYWFLLTETNYMGTAMQWAAINMGSNPIGGSRNLYLNGTLLTNLVFSDTTTIINSNFCYDTAIHAVTFPDGLVSIGKSAFFSCSGLTSISIPASVTSIGNYAFSGCTSLDSLYMQGSIPPSANANSFESMPTSSTLIVPCDALSVYQTQWGNYFSNIICNNITQYTLIVASASPIMGTVSGGGTYNSGATATLTATANSGYHFTHWQDNNTENPRTVTVTGNATYTAYFEADGGDDDCPTITSFPWNNTFNEDLSCWKTVDADGDGYNWGYYEGYVYSESYSYFDGSNQGLTPDNWLISRKIQIPSSGSYKLSWKAQALNDNYYNEHYTVYVSTSGDNPSNFTTQLYSETLNTPNVVNRSISLQNYQGQTVRIAFRHHNTNDMFVLGIADINIAQNTQGIDDIANEDFSIYALDGQIVVETELDDEIGIYDIVGRKVDGGSKSRFDVPSSGVYIVRIGDHPARKVVIIK